MNNSQNEEGSYFKGLAEDNKRTKTDLECFQILRNIVIRENSNQFHKLTRLVGELAAAKAKYHAEKAAEDYGGGFGFREPNWSWREKGIENGKSNVEAFKQLLLFLNEKIDILKANSG